MENGKGEYENKFYEENRESIFGRQQYHCRKNNADHTTIPVELTPADRLHA
jgi:hypothetical protein